MSSADFPIVYLTDLDTVKRLHQNADNTSSWSDEDDDLLTQCIEQASADVVGEIGWLPLPYVDTLLLDWSSDYVSRNSKQLWVSPDAYLLAVTTLTNGDLNTIASSAYVLEPNNRYPKRTIRLLSTNTTYFKAKTDGQWEQAITLAGIFGYVPHYPAAWFTTGQTVVNNPLSDSGTTLNIADATGFSRGQYLQLESETVLITAITLQTSPTPDDLTIERAVLGTTAAAHTMGTAVKRFRHNRSIQLATTEWASYLFRTKDQVEQQVEVYDNGLTIARGIRKTVYNALMKHTKVTVTRL